MKKYFIVLIAAISGCATGASKLVKSNNEGGRVMLIGTGSWMEDGAMKHAEKTMSAKCSNGYDKVEEGLMERPSDISLSGKTHVQEKYIEFKCKK